MLQAFLVTSLLGFLFPSMLQAFLVTSPDLEGERVGRFERIICVVNRSTRAGVTYFFARRPKGALTMICVQALQHFHHSSLVARSKEISGVSPWHVHTQRSTVNAEERTGLELANQISQDAAFWLAEWFRA